ncbi:glycosyltransferase family 39 protein [Pseudarthrobacter sp. IC2-21]|uniref:glycosyltransferase family 39 protein n=1 Tax=Pseudarthrobacter sp. IC2-21 TaxID=3092262 RepID=UPI002A6AB6CC|nr:glycosyltransferase family 39 protein [Pseudarthrobacter sp. IC2-21]
MSKLPTNSSKLDKWQLVIVLTLSLGAALICVGTPGIGFDEAATWWAARLEWPDLVRLLGNQDRNFGPYYAVMHIWMEVSDSLWWLRLPSAVGGALAVTATAGLARQMFGARTAWIAALLLVSAYSWVRFSQEVRPYSWSLAIATFATWAFITLAERRSRRLIAIYLILMVLLPITHLFAAMAAGVQLVYALVTRKRELALLAVGGALPSLVAAVLVIGQIKQVSWLSVVTPLEALRELVGQSKAIWYVPIALAACVGLAAYRWLQRGRSTGPAEVALFISWWAGPPFLLWIASVTVTPVYSARYVFWTLPAMILPAALLISRMLDLPKLRIPVLLTVACLMVLALPGQVSARAPNGHVWAPQVLTSVIIDQSRPGDALVDPGFLALTVKYHLNDHHLPEPLVERTAQLEGKFVDQQVPLEQQAERLKNYERLWVLDEIISERPLPVGFCRRDSWESDFAIARLTLAGRCD